MDKPLLPADRASSTSRDAIRSLYHERGIEPTPSGFGCRSLAACSATALRRNAPFATGNWAYVGVDYGRATLDGRPARILFVAMDRGGAAKANREPFAVTQQQFRLGAELRWNPHMGGVSTIMAYLVDEEDRDVYARQFALTNAVKCVEATGRAKTNATAVMIGQCAHHLEAELSVLRPDVVITQGSHPAHTVQRLLGARNPSVFGDSRSQRANVRLYATEVALLLTTPHPARLKGMGWSRGVLPGYFLDGVMATRAAYADHAAP